MLKSCALWFKMCIRDRHQEMQGYVRVSPVNSNVTLKAETRSVDAGT